MLVNLIVKYGYWCDVDIGFGWDRLNVDCEFVFGLCFIVWVSDRVV